MEVEYGPLDECKEGGEGALLPLHQLSEAAAADYPIQLDDGQLRLSRNVQLCSS
jgi:hypothetical protein